MSKVQRAKQGQSLSLKRKVQENMFVARVWSRAILRIFLHGGRVAVFMAVLWARGA